MSGCIEARWGKVPGRAACDRALGARTLRVLIALCSYANAEGFAWPSISSIATDTDTDRRNVSHEITTLLQAGYLELAGWRSHRCGRNRQYRIVLQAAGVSVSGDANRYASGETLTYPPTDPMDEGGLASGETLPVRVSGDAQTDQVQQTNSVPPVRPPSVDEHIGAAAAVSPTRATSSAAAPTSPPLGKASMLVSEEVNPPAAELVLTGEIEQPPQASKPRQAIAARVSATIIAQALAEFRALCLHHEDEHDVRRLFFQLCTRGRVDPQTIVQGMRRYVRLFHPHTRKDQEYAVRPANWLRRRKWTDGSPPPPPISDRTAMQRMMRGNAIPQPDGTWLIPEEGWKPGSAHADDPMTIDGVVCDVAQHPAAPAAREPSIEDSLALIAAAESRYPKNNFGEPRGIPPALLPPLRDALIATLAPPTKRDAEQIAELLTMLWPKKPTLNATAIVLGLSDIPPDAIRDAVTGLARTKEWPPGISEIIEDATWRYRSRKNLLSDVNRLLKQPDNVVRIERRPQMSGAL